MSGLPPHFPGAPPPALPADEGAYELRRPLPTVPFRLWEPFAVFLFVMVTQALVSAIIIGLTGGDVEKAAVIVAFEVVLAAWTIVWVRVAHQRGFDALGLHRDRVRAEVGFGLAWGALGWFGSTLVVGNIVLRIVDALSKAPIKEPDQLDYTSPSAAILAVTAFGVVVVAPIAEELFFRGFVFGALRSRLRFAPAAIASGALFMLAHAPFWLIFASIFTLGIFLSWVYQRRGSLVPCIVGHALFNAIGFAAYLATN